MKTVNFMFGIHNHQPVGNFDFVIEDAYQKSYLPFLEIVEEFPAIAISFHYSGCLLEWLDVHHPEYLDRVAKLVKRGNVEIVSGGFYEPVLAMISDRDKVGQIQMLNDFIRKRFKYEPRGLWLTERVWEPGLAKPIAEAGIKYITVDDYHFVSTGMDENDLTGHFITEEQGTPLSIFPINQKLRYAIPFKNPQETLGYLAKYATETGDNGIVMADDGEKFGVWPGTYETVFEGNWLRDFFEILTENSSWIKTKTFSDYYDAHPPKGRTYLPTASYFEMSEWTLPWEAGEKFSDLVHEFEAKERFDEVRSFLKGGMWRNFQAKYDESNWMQKKALYLSNKLAAIDTTKLTKKQKADYDTAKQHLWRSECNCAFWHGVFGGLYLPHLRFAIYYEQLKCEQLLAGLEKRTPFHIDQIDIDIDGQDEILVRYKDLMAAVSPHRGGMLEEFDLVDKGFNLLNTLKRYKETYHRKVYEADNSENTSGSIHDIVMTKEKGLDKYLKYDKFPRKMLVDHIIKPTVSLEQFMDGQYYEDSDFLLGKYDVRIDKKARKIIMTKDGGINWKNTRITKSIQFTAKSLEIEYKLENTSSEANEFRFGPEFNFALLGGDTPDRYYTSTDKKFKENRLIAKSVEKKLTNLGIVNEWDKFQVDVVREKAGEFWRFPIETVSLSEAGFERVYQSSVIIPWFDIKLKSGASKTIKLSLQVKNLK